MSSVWCSPQDWDKHTKPCSSALSDTKTACIHNFWCTRGKTGRIKGRWRRERKTLREDTSIPASLNASSCTLPPLPPLHPSSVHSRTEDGFTFCPGFQALLHRWVPAAALPQWRRARAGWEWIARRGNRGGMRVQPLRQWKETAAGWAPLHNLLS